MRRPTAALYALLVVLMPAAASAGSEAEELGHHWESPVYTQEIHLQLILMAAVTCGILVWSAMARARRRRSLER